MSHKLLHAPIQDFIFRGGGSRPDGQRTVWTFFLFLFRPQHILQFTEGIQWFYNRENYIFDGSRGGQTFQGGSNFFHCGQMLISIETHITGDFPGGGGSGPPIPLLDPHLLLGLFDM